jgi:8-oxo-dGTP diphosphatase
MSDNTRPKVGIGVCIIKDGKVLLGKRLSSHGTDTWSFAGGHLEFGESFAECATREVREEAGIEISEPTFMAVTNDVYEKEQKHYVTIFVKAHWLAGEPQVLEPDKIAGWQWFDWDDLPTPLFLPIIHLLESGFTLL